MTASEVVYTWIEYPKDITQPCFEGSVSHILLLFCIKQNRLHALEKIKIHADGFVYLSQRISLYNLRLP